jgi:hypothetical protein
MNFKKNNYTMEIFNVFSKEECLDVINQYNRNLKENVFYKDTDIDCSKFKYIKKINNCIDVYKKEYPAINLTASKWRLDRLTFKAFLNGGNFGPWHSEHSMCYPNRVLALQVYLTNHNCGTQFFSKKIIKSEIGKVLLFPAYFTHTHRGQSCPEKKDRYIITGYYLFYEKGKHEF